MFTMQQMLAKQLQDALSERSTVEAELTKKNALLQELTKKQAVLEVDMSIARPNGPPLREDVYHPSGYATRRDNLNKITIERDACQRDVKELRAKTAQLCTCVSELNKRIVEYVQAEATNKYAPPPPPTTETAIDKQMTTMIMQMLKTQQEQMEIMRQQLAALQVQQTGNNNQSAAMRTLGTFSSSSVPTPSQTAASSATTSLPKPSNTK
ncbi:MAG: hypothetical protein WCW01_06930 [Gammaproteobacteria bacterium]